MRGKQQRGSAGTEGERDQGEDDGDYEVPSVAGPDQKPAEPHGSLGGSEGSTGPGAAEDVGGAAGTTGAPTAAGIAKKQKVVVSFGDEDY